MKKSAWGLLAIGIIFLVVVSASELLSSHQGLGPYQITIIGIGLLFVFLGLNRAKYLGIILYGVLGLSLLLLSIELLLSFEPANKRPELDDTLLGIRPAPSAETDTLGWRNASVPADVDFVAIGDSLTWGVRAKTAEETWAGVLGASLGLVDYRMAYFGYGTNQYLALSQEALSLNPETLIIGFHFGTDILDTFRYSYELSAYENLRSSEISESLGRAGLRENYLADYSNEALNQRINGYVDAATDGLLWSFVMDTYLGRWIWGDSLREELEFEAMRETSQQRPDIVQLYEDGSYLTPLIVGRRLMAQDLTNPRIAEGLRLAELNLAAIQSLANEADVQLLFVSIPSKEFVYAALVAAPDETFQAMIAAETQMRLEIFAFLDKQGIVYVDTLPCLLEAAQNHEEIFTEAHDGHPSPLGYHLMADCIAPAYPN